MKIHDYQVFTVSNHSRVLLRIHELEKEASVRKKKEKKKKYIYIYQTHRHLSAEKYGST